MRSQSSSPLLRNGSPPRTPKQSASVTSLPPLSLKLESPHVYGHSVTVDVSKLLESNAKKRASTSGSLSGRSSGASQSSPSFSASMWLEFGPTDVEGTRLWPPGKPVGTPPGALKIREQTRRPPWCGPKPGSPMYFAQDAALERFDEERLKQQEQTPLTCLRAPENQWMATLRAVPPDQPVPSRRPPHFDEAIQAGKSWRRLSEAERNKHLLPEAADGGVERASALKLICDVGPVVEIAVEAPPPPTLQGVRAAAPTAPTAPTTRRVRDAGTGTAPAKVLHLIEGSEVQLLLECCNANRERMMSVKGSTEKYADATAALEAAARECAARRLELPRAQTPQTSREASSLARSSSSH